MLADKYSTKKLASILIPRSEWQPYPTIKDVAAWRALPGSVREAHIACGSVFLDYEWPHLPATLFLQFARAGNRRNYEIPHFARRAALGHLVIAECIENQGRFLDDIANGIWTICEETYWGVPAHVGVQQAGSGLPDSSEPTVDLFAAETGALLAWSHYLLDDRLDAVSPLIRSRIEREVNHRILIPCETRDDFWWMGFDTSARGGRRVNNWNPWICSNWLALTLLLERDERRRQQTVFRIMQVLDKFIDPYPRDGGCDEGPSYWGRAGASLFDNLELFYSASGGQIDVYQEPLIQEIGRFIYRVHIADDYYINFADAPALVYPDAMLVFRFGQRIEDENMISFGAWLAERQGIRDGTDKQVEEEIQTKKRGVPQSLSRLLPALFSLHQLSDMTVHPPLPQSTWLPDIEVMVVRDEAGSEAGFFLAAKGGHNDESHNHNDVGNFIVYTDGKPLIVDAGVETYTAKTFGPQRYNIWTMQSAYHSLLPTIDGVQQLPGAQFRASEIDHQGSTRHEKMVLDISTAYPQEAGIEFWHRTITLNRGRSIEVADRFQLGRVPREITLSILTPCTVDLNQPGQILFSARTFLPGRESGDATIRYEGATMEVTQEQIPISDERLSGTWGEFLNRIVLTAAGPGMSGTWRYEISRA